MYTLKSSFIRNICLEVRVFAFQEKKILSLNHQIVFFCDIFLLLGFMEDLGVSEDLIWRKLHREWLQSAK